MFTIRVFIILLYLASFFTLSKNISTKKEEKKKKKGTKKASSVYSYILQQSSMMGDPAILAGHVHVFS